MSNSFNTNYDTNEFSVFEEKAPVHYGSFWERFAAAFIDGIIIAIPNFFLTSLLNAGEPYGLGNLAGLILGWLYYALQDSSNAQATLGKKAMGLRVTDESGNKLSFLNATGRHFGKILSALILCIGYLMMLWSDKKQTLHDKLAGTLVVKS